MAKLGQNDITPFTQLRRAEVVNRNSGGAITLTTPGSTVITTVNLGTVIKGDRILVNGRVDLTKGATAGDIQIVVQKNAGTATVQMYDNKTTISEYRPNIPITGIVHFNIFALIKVTATGTLTIEISGISAGSNSTINASDGQLYAAVLYGE